ncbi:MAG: cyclase family protein [Bacteroidetes bacterium]|nr:cyclase family protein [Bacteroidota bacterium]MCH8246466.1 cyclase family protein [Bacteroidota bacterium]
MKYFPRLILLFLFGCSEPSDETPYSFPDGTIVDLSYAFGSDTIYWPTADGFERTTEFEGRTESGYYYSAYTFRTAEHGGTHLDAPIHFSEGGQTTDTIPLDHLMGDAVVIDVTEAAAADRDYLVSTADIEAWESEHGAIPDGAIVLIRTGYGQYWPDAEAYLGTAERGADAIPLLHFPGLDPKAAKWLVENRSIHALGIDTASIDYGQSTLYETHQILLGENIPGFENLANLDQLPESGSVVIALPMKIEGGSGGPLRIVAIVGR